MPDQNGGTRQSDKPAGEEDGQTTGGGGGAFPAAATSEPDKIVFNHQQQDDIIITTTTTTASYNGDKTACDSNTNISPLVESSSKINSLHSNNSAGLGMGNGTQPTILEASGDIITVPPPAPPIPIDPTSIGSKSLNIADFIGEIGLYQLSLTLLTFIRYICVALMTNTGPLIAPRITHFCRPPADIEPLVNFTSKNHDIDLMNKCQLDLKNGSSYGCTRWSYDQDQYGITLTDTFDLVCGHDWLRSAFQSSVSVGVTVASIVFGPFSDEHGRKLTLKICYTISLVAGLLSYWAPSFTIYTVSRAVCSMSDLGIVGSLYTIIVETFGNKYRGTICLIVFTGWSMGVMVMPFVTSYCMDFKRVMLFTVVCHVVTLPWLMTIGESIRWLLINGRIEEARHEIRRICKWNSASEADLLRVESKFQASKAKYQMIAVQNEIIRAKELEAGQGLKPARITKYRRLALRAFFGGFFKVGQILKSRELTITTLVMVWTTFNSEFLYMLFILINSDVGDNVTLNYAIGGLMEILATLISIVMFARLTRRFSLSSTLTIISMSILLLAFTHQQPTVSVWALNFTKFAISTLSSLIYVTVTELFPTSLRQTGMGVAATMGSFGAVIAPFVRTELTDMIGMTNVMLTLCLFPLSVAILIPLHLRETKGLDLADDVDDIV